MAKCSVCRKGTGTYKAVWLQVHDVEGGMLAARGSFESFDICPECWKAKVPRVSVTDTSPTGHSLAKALVANLRRRKANAD